MTYDSARYDTWRIALLSGDCNDYAVTKRHELLAILLLAEVVTPRGEDAIAGQSEKNWVEIGSMKFSWREF